MTVRKLVDATTSSTPSSITLSSTVCIIGGGIAGLTAAVRLARDPRVRVVVLESGIDKDDPDTLALDHIDNPRKNYEGSLRSRGLGGTSRRWDGKLLPFSSGDTAERPWVGLSAWPFDVAELDRYVSEIERLMGVDRASYEEDIAPLLDPSGLLPRDDSDFRQRWAKRPSKANLDLAHVLRDDIATRDNLDIWLGATVSTFGFDPSGSRLAFVVAVDRHGHTLTVTADEFLIAAGALESTRLLLVADRQSGGVISRDSDALGRYFNDHFGIEVAAVRPIDHRRTNMALADRWVLGPNRHLHFELRRAVQEAGRIGSAYFDFVVEVPETSALTQAESAVQAAKQRRVRIAVRSAAAALTDLPTLTRIVTWRYRDKLRYWPPHPSARIKIWIEQLPHRRNRIVLSDCVDALGQPLLRLEFEKTDDEERAFRFTVEKVRAFWERHMSGLATLDWIPMVDDPHGRLVELSAELAHPAGATRMGLDPATSVVDPWLRVHRVSNLSVASSSTFPSSGSANPTFMIMQLAMRAADAIATRLQPQPDSHEAQPTKSHTAT
ncbi:GMC oxidoreductase [Mycolicibacterium baixiangningiae]|uniref:GMC oxidoreductase n=1 Tax=Mycolicibacterium baixiangningiae TaxID=2761578 RepID=UPI001866AE5B|nr:GMC oxidoreductase [Mycolicibacterium baixiangningiae]